MTSTKNMLTIEEKTTVKRTISEPNLSLNLKSDCRRGRANRYQKPRSSSFNQVSHEIADIDSYLTKASIENPANIPAILSFTSVLYQTQRGIQDEIALPLGTMVNTIFKNQTWLYVQTPHGQEGYVLHAACLPLGILPRPKKSSHCWEDSTDIFPKPLGNSSKLDRTRLGTWSESGTRRRRRMRLRIRSQSSCLNHHELDHLFSNFTPENSNESTSLSKTLLVIGHDFEAQGENLLNVQKGDIVTLLSGNEDWYCVCTCDGMKGMIPTIIVESVVYNCV